MFCSISCDIIFVTTLSADVYAHHVRAAFFMLRGQHCMYACTKRVHPCSWEMECTLKDLKAQLCTRWSEEKKKKVYPGLNMFMLVDNEQQCQLMRFFLKNFFKAERESATQRESQSQEEGHQSPCCLCIFRPHEPR